MKTAVPMRAAPLNRELGSISGTPPTTVIAGAIDATPSNTSRTALNFFIWLALLILNPQDESRTAARGEFVR